MLYSLDEICLIPATTSSIEHRGDVNVFTNKNKLPLFVAPMSCLTDENNFKKLEDSLFNVIIPRSVKWATRKDMIRNGHWVAVGLKEAEYLCTAATFNNCTIRVCIDQANGHMQHLLEVCKTLKDKFGDRIKIMTGNIANPFTYRQYAMVGIDYVRCSVGSGNVCTTSVQTGMHYPMGSLIIKCLEEKQLVIKSKELGAQYRSVPKIVADGGFKRIDQIIKALALGADYVMLGEIIAKSEEACGTIVAERNKYGFKTREYFGMSTEKAQLLVNEASLFFNPNFVPKHPEGQIKTIEVEYTLKEWTTDFMHALRSSMSYAGANNLERFIGHVKWDNMTPVTYNAYMK